MDTDRDTDTIAHAPADVGEESSTVEHMLACQRDVGLALTLVVGADGLSRRISKPRVQKPGLALTGYTGQLHPQRLLVLGATEIVYLSRVDTAQRQLAVNTMMASSPACFVITRGLSAPEELMGACAAAATPLLASELTSHEFITRVTSFLKAQASPSTTMHGVLVDVLGLGVLVLGKSGVGKSETALELVTRGHRLVADDIVYVRRQDDLAYGSGSDLLRHHLEIRGLGIINIKDLFGVTAVRETKKIELVIELCEWDGQEEYDRLGIDDKTISICDVAVPVLRLPVRPGRNMSTIIEVAARNQLLKFQGHHAARAFQERLSRAMVAAQQVKGAGGFTGDTIE